MNTVLDEKALRAEAERLIDGKSSRENVRFLEKAKLEVIGGPETFTVVGVSREFAVEAVYAALRQRVLDKIAWENNQWRGG